MKEFEKLDFDTEVCIKIKNARMVITFAIH